MDFFKPFGNILEHSGTAPHHLDDEPVHRLIASVPGFLGDGGKSSYILGIIDVWIGLGLGLGQCFVYSYLPDVVINLVRLV